MSRPPYLILHGYQGSGPGHWQSWLAGRLRSGEATVRFPDLPDADAPRLETWLEALERELDSFGDPPTVICHSLACLLWMHHAAGGGPPAGRPPPRRRRPCCSSPRRLSPASRTCSTPSSPPPRARWRTPGS